jgi:hypothetical protein
VRPPRGPCPRSPTLQPLEDAFSVDETSTRVDCIPPEDEALLLVGRLERHGVAKFIDLIGEKILADPFQDLPAEGPFGQHELTERVHAVPVRIALPRRADGYRLDEILFEGLKG